MTRTRGRNGERARAAGGRRQRGKVDDRMLFDGRREGARGALKGDGHELWILIGISESLCGRGATCAVQANSTAIVIAEVWSAPSVPVNVGAAARILPDSIGSRDGETSRRARSAS